MINCAELLLGGLEHIRLLFPRAHVDFHEADIGVGALGLGELVDVAGEDFGAVLDEAADGCETDAAGSAYSILLAYVVP